MTTHTTHGRSTSVVRTSILTFPADRMIEAEKLMAESEAGLRGILDLPGLRTYTAGIDRVGCQFINVSEWDSNEHASQMSSFQPMLDLAKKTIELNATFLSPIPNFEQLWRWDNIKP